MRFIPDVSPKAFTLSAIIIGYLLIDDTTANEQNALGNWLMLVAQVLCTNAYYKQVQQERGIDTSGTGTNNTTPNTSETIVMMQKMMNAMQQEIDELKKQL